MNTFVIIPARFSSTRYPGKPLAKIKGREAILWTYMAGLAIPNVTEVLVATDSERIRTVVEAVGGRVVMTSDSCRNGTERVAQAAERIGAKADDIIINLQGDAPLTPPWFIEAIVAELSVNRLADMVTPVLRCDEDNYQRFVDDRKNGRVGATTAVFTKDRRALYFSKEVLPYLPNVAALKRTPVFHHVGVYGYRFQALEEYPNWEIGALEEAEQLEQLRFLESGRSVFVTEVADRGHQFWELNNPSDVQIIEEMIDVNSAYIDRKES